MESEAMLLNSTEKGFSGVSGRLKCFAVLHDVDPARTGERYLIKARLGPAVKGDNPAIRCGSVALRLAGGSNGK